MFLINIALVEHFFKTDHSFVIFTATQLVIIFNNISNLTVLIGLFDSLALNQRWKHFRTHLSVIRELCEFNSHFNFSLFVFVFLNLHFLS